MQKQNKAHSRAEDMWLKPMSKQHASCTSQEQRTCGGNRLPDSMPPAPVKSRGHVAETDVQTACPLHQSRAEGMWCFRVENEVTLVANVSLVCDQSYSMHTRKQISEKFQSRLFENFTRNWFDTINSNTGNRVGLGGNKLRTYKLLKETFFFFFFFLLYC